jgi:hypothetical protein
MKRRLSLLSVAVVLCSFYLFVAAAGAQVQGEAKANERPIVLKGMSLGMDISEARKICVNLLAKDWNISQIGARDDLMADYRDTFGADRMPAVGLLGFLIKSKGGYLKGYGFISDDGSGKVSQITFSGELTDYIFSVTSIDADRFVSAFIKNFQLPEFQWIKHGWYYASPKGYELTFMNDKAMDIKKSDKGKTEIKIKFD